MWSLYPFVCGFTTINDSLTNDFDKWPRNLIMHILNLLPLNTLILCLFKYSLQCKVVVKILLYEDSADIFSCHIFTADSRIYELIHQYGHMLFIGTISI